MSLLDLVTEKVVQISLTAKDKNGVIEELIILLEKNGMITNRGLVFKDVLAREEQGSTGLEHGIAVPHGKTSGVTELTVAVGVSQEGVYFDSIDGKPAKLIFLVLSTPDQSGPHITMLKDIAFFVNDEGQRARLLAAKSPAEIVRALRKINP